MSLDTLPTELLILIGNHIDNLSLHYLALTCCRFYVVFVPILWARIDLAPITYNGLYSEQFNSFSVLCCAAALNSIDMGKRLLAKYPDTVRRQLESPIFSTLPMFNACLQGNKEFVELLLCNGYPATPRHQFVYMVAPLFTPHSRRQDGSSRYSTAVPGLQPA